MRILNLYAGIGGNRKLWKDVDVTAVEFDKNIAAIYQNFFPKDTVIIADAHQYLLDHYKEFDFIWSSPPCPTHSCLVFSNESRMYNCKKMKYPDMKLYQEIILLKSFRNCKFVVENVNPYYKPLIENQLIGRHLLWSNFLILPFNKKDNRKHVDIENDSTVYGVCLSQFKIRDKKKLLRNMVNPEVGKHILDCARNYQIKSEQLCLF